MLIAKCTPKKGPPNVSRLINKDPLVWVPQIHTHTRIYIYISGDLFRRNHQLTPAKGSSFSWAKGAFRNVAGGFSFIYDSFQTPTPLMVIYVWT